MAKKTGKNTTANTTGKVPPKSPSKQEEFNAFLDLLRGEAVYHWVQIADVLGVDRDTITRWKQHPAAKKAIRDGIEKTLEGMTKAGEKDWRMWESKAKMLGLSPIEKTDITSKGEQVKIAVVSYDDVKDEK